MAEGGSWLRRTVRFARMAGTSTAAPDAAPWVTDFLNAAYYARPAGERHVDDLRLAFAVLTTRWWRAGRRLHLTDLPRFHRAFGRGRIGRRGGFGRLDREALLAGAESLLGEWFPDAPHDPPHRGGGVTFPTRDARAAYVPEARMRHARLGPLTPPERPPGERVWQSYAPVPAPDVARTLARITAPETWPDFGSDHGRFTPLRGGGLRGQTFEIEVVAGAGTRHPLITRGYVTATDVVGEGDAGALAAAVGRLDEGLGATGPAVPAGQEPVAVVQLTTHAGHFIGPAVSTLLLTGGGGGGTLRDVGCWDPMAFPHRAAYRMGGRAAQHAFWGEGAPSASMLHQLADPADPVGPPPG